MSCTLSALITGSCHTSRLTVFGDVDVQFKCADADFDRLGEGTQRFPGGLAAPSGDGPADRTRAAARRTVGTRSSSGATKPASRTGDQSSGQRELTSALTRDFGQHHPGGHRGIQRFGLAGHRDGDHLVAVLPHQPRQSLALRTDHHAPMGRCRRDRPRRCHRRRPARPPAIPRSAQSFSVLVRLVARATGTRAAAPALVRQATAVTEAERRCGITTPWPPNAATDRTIAPRLRGSEMLSNATNSAGDELIADDDQIVGMGVVERRHLQRDALMQVVGRHPVQIGARHLEDGDSRIGRAGDGFGHPLVGFRTERDVERRRRNTGTQAFHHRVAAEHGLGFVNALGRTAAAAAWTAWRRDGGDAYAPAGWDPGLPGRAGAGRPSPRSGPSYCRICGSPHGVASYRPST